jgi:hypothetical protein
VNNSTETDAVTGPPSDPVEVDHADYIQTAFREDFHRRTAQWLFDRWRFSVVFFCEQHCNACDAGWSLDQARSFLAAAVEDQVAALEEEMTREADTKSFGITGRRSS